MYLKFRKKRVKRLKFEVSPKAQFYEIFTVFHEVDLPCRNPSKDNIMYAVLELVNNSLRAQRECNSHESIKVTFEVDAPRLHVEVLDYGGGFDPSHLPYDVSSDPSNVDLNGDVFQQYRNLHNNTRFGMGLYIARKTFDRFDLGFIDSNHIIHPWGEPGIIGTVIRLSLEGERP
jgi:signal transduction histidine kinase